MRQSLCATWASRGHLAALGNSGAAWRQLTGAAGSAAQQEAAAARSHVAGGSGTGQEAAGEQQEDRILLRGLVFHGYHGVLPEERVLGQKFTVDATLSTDLRAAGASDDLAHTVSYAAVYEDIKAVVEGPPAQLLEAVAERIAARVLEAHPPIRAVTLSIRKPHVAVGGVVESLGIEITRRRQRPSGSGSSRSEGSGGGQQQERQARR